MGIFSFDILFGFDRIGITDPVTVISVAVRSGVGASAALPRQRPPGGGGSPLAGRCRWSARV